MEARGEMGRGVREKLKCYEEQNLLFSPLIAKDPAGYFSVKSLLDSSSKSCSSLIEVLPILLCV